MKIPVYDWIGKGLSRVIRKKKKIIGIFMEYILSQDYDWAPAISGTFKGVFSLRKNKLLTHCTVIRK